MTIYEENSRYIDIDIQEDGNMYINQLDKLSQPEPYEEEEDTSHEYDDYDKLVDKLREEFADDPDIEYEEEKYPSEYERQAFNIETALVKEKLGVETDEELLALMAEKYGNEKGFDQFTEWLNDNGINYDYYSGY